MGKKNKEEPKTSTKNEEEKPEHVISYIALYRYADIWDWLCVIIGGLSALVHGGLTPAFIIFFGDVIDSFSVGADPNSLVLDVTQTSYYILYLAAGAFVTSYFQVSFFTLSAQRQSLRVRKLYFRALIRQDMAWYDTQHPAALTTRISSDIPAIQEALGDKFGSFLQFVGMFLGGIIVGFIYGWQLTLLVIALGPLIGIGGAMMSKMIGDAAAGGLGFFADANALADEIIRMMKTIIAFETQDTEEKRFQKEVEKAKHQGERGAKFQGLGMGYTFFIIFISYPLAFWLGQYLVNEGQMTGGDVLLVFFSVIIGAMSLGQAAPNIAVMAKGRAAGTKIFEIIDRTPKIDSLSTSGIVPKSVVGHIAFKDVDFTYPSRPDEQVLHKLTLDILPQETVALVGHSGCGKSTTVGLVERFYDPDSGSISLDGTNIKELNIQWFRSQIALVSQTPALFPTSIEDNIAIGKEGATKQEVIEAAKKANAHDFIMELPDGYKTSVGDLGTQLSGGQRQRIAIARALIKNPPILLLDEATSALDNESEAIVKDALDRASKTRTTIVIAHRLSTVFNADKIAVVDGGRIVEFGTPQQLLDAQGRFYKMVTAQHGGEGQGRAVIDIKNFTESNDIIDEEEVDRKESIAIDVALTDELKDDAADDADVPDVDRNMLSWVYEMNKPERAMLIVGIICSALEGAVWGVYAIILSEIINVLNTDNSATQVNKWAGAFFGIATGVFIFVFLKFWMLGVAGERLTARLRNMAFHVIVRQDAAWYDNPKHSRGVLTARLASDASLVKGVLGDRLGIFVQLVSIIAVGLTVALVYCWRVGLVVLASLPAIAIAGAIQFKMVSGFTTSKAFEQSGKFASQSIEQVRTVAALGRLEDFVQDYYKTLEYPVSVMRKSAQVQGLTFGVSEFCMFAVWALAFWYGSEVVDQGHCGFTEMFTSQMAIVFMGMMAGQISTFAPDAAKANGAAKRLYKMITDQEEKDAHISKRELAKPTITGRIELKDVEFTYATRPDAKVLKGINLTIEPGKTTALVGSSGCGKSTIISLLERYYEPEAGFILFDGVESNYIDSKHLRKHIAIVTQQPELFANSIAENICYGMEGDVSASAIEQAAKDANAYDFIQEFDDKFETQVGEKGEQLSGGQRQRIAIARALIRSDDIKILLLDEASAALDTESERLVHHALDKARQGRTTVIVAHRLSTIKNADTIAVIKEGVVVEQGSHDDLIAQEGAYYDLVHSQEFVKYDDEDDGNHHNSSTNGGNNVNDVVVSNINSGSDNKDHEETTGNNLNGENTGNDDNDDDDEEVPNTAVEADVDISHIEGDDYTEDEDSAWKNPSTFVLQSTTYRNPLGMLWI